MVDLQIVTRRRKWSPEDKATLLTEGMDWRRTVVPPAREQPMLL